ncbi:MAG: vitamin K epoxide reductase family protein [Patescibacteria group bacterium]
MSVQKIFSYILIVGSTIGLWASFVLTVDIIEFIKNPNVSLPCNINPFISCTNVATHWQSEIFGFPNSLLGIVAFGMLLAIGIMLLSGGRAKKPLWLLVNLGTVAAMGFVMWFFFESVYRIGSLCIYCMITWVVTWPLFLYTTVWNFRENHFTFPSLKIKQQELINSFFHFVSKYHIQILIVWYLVIIFLILFRFKDFFFN